MSDDVWAGLERQWREQIGEFDGFALYLRRPAGRAGFSLLPLRAGDPVGLIKLKRGSRETLEHEYKALAAVVRFSPTSFEVPTPIAVGQEEEWNFLALTPLPPLPHRAPRFPPLALILREIAEALADLPRAADTPAHWRPMHGDFTPWNLRQLPGARLVLFDWENAGWGPPGADATLYRATLAALARQTGGRWPYAEAVSYWEKDIRRRAAVGRRGEREIATLLKQSLKSGRVAARHPPRTPPGRRPRALVFAYAAEPGRGSEPAAGWGLVRAIGEFADGVVLVAPEHAAGIREWQSQHPAGGLTFVEVPEPRLARYGKWHRIPWFLVYLAWLRRARQVAAALESGPFDLTCHATYSTYWLPTPAVHMGVPCMWGPVGGGARTPLRLWPLLGVRGLLDELLDLASVRLASLWPATRRTWRRAQVRILQNEESLERLPKSLRLDSRLLNHAFFVEPPTWRPRSPSSDLLWVGSLEARKGPVLALCALAQTPPSVRLVMVGDGPERRRVQRCARRLGLTDRVEMVRRVPREEVWGYLARAAAVVFTGLREEGGIALAEAMLAGAPVIVLANGGARTVAAASTDPRRVVLVYPSTVRETSRRLAAAMSRLAGQSPRASSPMLDQEAARDALRQALEDALSANGRHRA